MTTRTYYLLRLTQLAPLRISTGFGETTDNDLTRDARGVPYIPGSSLAGALRALLSPEEGDTLFGHLDGQRSVESCIAVSDGVLMGDESGCEICVRDGVGLTEEGVAEDGKKYDFEVLETAAPFEAVLEVNDPDGAGRMQALAEKTLALAAGGFSLGARTTRGYGSMSIAVRRRVFRFPADLDAWLSWDPRSADDWEEGFVLPAVRCENRVEIRARLRLSGSFAVRVYADPDERGIDHTYLRQGGSAERAVIPGTTWAGVFRHHMRDLCREAGLGEEALEAVNSFFGSPKDQHNIRRSRITFGETVVTGGAPMEQQRVAVDRFTAKPRSGALYRTQAYRGGEGELRITFPAGASNETLLALLSVCLLDLHHGLMPFGGETGVGRGTAAIAALTVNGENRLPALLNDELTLMKEAGA